MKLFHSNINHKGYVTYKDDSIEPILSRDDVSALIFRVTALGEKSDITGVFYVLTDELRRGLINDILSYKKKNKIPSQGLMGELRGGVLTHSSVRVEPIFK